MAEEGEVAPVVEEMEVEAKVEAPAAPQVMDIYTALKDVLKHALIQDGLARGLRECAKALDRRQAHVCILAADCNEEAYVKLVEALCTEHNIGLIRVPKAKDLGEWVGLCKIDREGTARKVVACSCVVIKEYGEATESLNVLMEHLKTK